MEEVAQFWYLKPPQFSIRSSRLNSALRCDETVYWVSIGQQWLVLGGTRSIFKATINSRSYWYIFHHGWQISPSCQNKRRKWYCDDYERALRQNTLSKWFQDQKEKMQLMNTSFMRESRTSSLNHWLYGEQKMIWLNLVILLEKNTCLNKSS